MDSVLVLNEDVLVKLKKNAKKKGVTPEVWIEEVVDREFTLSNLPRFTEQERAKMHEYSKDMDRRYTELMKKKYRKKMGLDVK